MKKWTGAFFGIITVSLLCGCGSFGKGAATGAAVAGAGYEIKAKHELDKLEEEYDKGKITEAEYKARRKEIRKGSIIY